MEQITFLMAWDAEKTGKRIEMVKDIHVVRVYIDQWLKTDAPCLKSYWVIIVLTSQIVYLGCFHLTSFSSVESH